VAGLTPETCSMPLTRRRQYEAHLSSGQPDIYAEMMEGWDRLEIHAQPIRALANGEVVATEALVRWRRSPGELWAAEMVLPIAEETGVIDACTRRALEMSLAAWAGSTGRSNGGRFALNLHRSRLESSSLITDLHRMCVDFGVDPTELIFEIPDGLGGDGCRAAVRTLASVVDAGATVALDDHRGEASETRPDPSWLPCGSIVKLDAAITDLCDHPLGRAVLEETAGRLNDLGYLVAAEMIERAEQFRTARDCGVAWAQGHLFGPPQLFC
jgi:EAL domain-containing protein (putative c-di-GMP-specific phosphodiesterase class I)